jgi:hypothetical protein
VRRKERLLLTRATGFDLNFIARKELATDGISDSRVAKFRNMAKKPAHYIAQANRKRFGISGMKEIVT